MIELKYLLRDAFIVKSFSLFVTAPSAVLSTANLKGNYRKQHDIKTGILGYYRCFNTKDCFGDLQLSVE